MVANSISFGYSHVRYTPMGVYRTCGEPSGIKKNTHPKNTTTILGEQAALKGDFPKCLSTTRGKSTPVPARALVFQAGLAMLLVRVECVAATKWGPTRPLLL